MEGLIRVIGFLRNISVNSLHKGDDGGDDDDDDDNNNNNTGQCSDGGADTSDSFSQEYKCK